MNQREARFIENASHFVTSVCGRHYCSSQSISAKLLCVVLAPAENARIANSSHSSDPLGISRNKETFGNRLSAMFNRLMIVTKSAFFTGWGQCGAGM